MESKSTNNIINQEPKTIIKENIRESLKPIVAYASNSGISQTVLIEIITELCQANRCITTEKINLEISSKIIDSEELFRKKAKKFIKEYGYLFMLLDENSQFYEDLFWTMYLCLQYDKNITRELVSKRFIANQYNYNSLTNFFKTGLYKKMSINLLNKLYFDSTSRCLCTSYSDDCCFICDTDEFSSLSKLFSKKSNSFYARFATYSLTCILFFV